MTAISDIIEAPTYLYCPSCGGNTTKIGKINIIVYGEHMETRFVYSCIDCGDIYAIEKRDDLKIKEEFKIC